MHPWCSRGLGNPNPTPLDNGIYRTVDTITHCGYRYTGYCTGTLALETPRKWLAYLVVSLPLSLSVCMCVLEGVCYTAGNRGWLKG